jgi:hypothetical protein
MAGIPQPPERIAHNEAIFREVNETIEAGRWPGEEGSAIAFRCECGELGCSDLIELTSAEYEQVRSHPRRFLIAPGHELPDAEDVIERQPRYLVVEKREQAGQVAEAKDPRTGSD